jgi:uncharacterized protein with GYD domain
MSVSGECQRARTMSVSADKLASMTHPARTADPGAKDKLRSILLTSGLYDWVPLVEVKTAIAHYNLATTPAAQQDLALQTIRSLLEDGLMQIGDLPGPDGKFPAWELPIDAAMERVYDRFVLHHRDPTQWEFSIWLGLTDSGKRLAENAGSKGAQK